MASTAHHLRRLRLQVHTTDQATGQILRGRFEAGFSRRLAAVVAAVCDDLGPRDGLLRLERLELDLGAFALERLEAEAPEALERALREALHQALAAALHNPSPETRWLTPAAARLERLAAFLRLGVWPFQSVSRRAPEAPEGRPPDGDPGDSASAAPPSLDPASEIVWLLERDPAGLLVLLRQLAVQRSALERLLLHLNGDRFARLLSLLAPADATLILAYLAELLRLHQLQPLLPLAPEPLAHSLRLLTLILLLRDPGSAFNRRVFLEQLLRQLALEQHLPYADLLAALRQALAASQRLQPASGVLLAPLVELLSQEFSAAGSLTTALAAALVAARGFASGAASGAGTGTVGGGGTGSERGSGVASVTGAGAAQPGAAGPGGDLTPLLALLRDHPDQAAVQRALAPRLDGLLFARLVQALAPQQAPLVLAYVDDVVAVQRQQPLLPLAVDPFERQLRSIALRLLLHPAASPFARRVFLEQLLRQLAQSQQLAYPLLLRSLAASLARLPQPLCLESALPALVAELVSREFGAGAADPATTAAAALGVAPPVGPPVAPSDAPPDAFASVPAGTPSDPAPALTLSLEHWQAFLRDGLSPQLGPRLHDAVLADPEGFVVLLRQLLAAAPPGGTAAEGPGQAVAHLTQAGLNQVGGEPSGEAVASVGWLERLLRWLLPESLALLAATAAGEPHPPARGFALWAERRADQARLPLAAAWRELLPLLLSAAAPTPRAADLALAPLASGQLDRSAALRHWLRHGVLPAWLTPDVPMPALQAPSPQPPPPVLTPPPTLLTPPPTLTPPTLAPAGPLQAEADAWVASGAAVVDSGGDPTPMPVDPAACAPASIPSAPPPLNASPVPVQADAAAFQAELMALANGPELELLRLLLPLAPGAEALSLALQRLGQWVPGAAFTALLERLLPWLRQPTGVLAEALAATSPAERPALRLRAVALVLSGEPVSLTALREPLPPLPPQPGLAQERAVQADSPPAPPPEPVAAPAPPPEPVAAPAPAHELAAAPGAPHQLAAAPGAPPPPSPPSTAPPVQPALMGQEVGEVASTTTPAALASLPGASSDSPSHSASPGAPAASPASAAIPPPPAPTDRQRLLAWLRGEGPESPPQWPTLLRLFAELADQADAELGTLLGDGLAEPALRQRWIRHLPDALLGRVVLLLQPGRGRLLLDLQALLAVAAAQAGPAVAAGAPVAPAAGWEGLLSLLALPDPLPSRAIAQRLLACYGPSGMGGDTSRLRRHAARLALNAGAPHLLAVLEPDRAPPPPPRPALEPWRFPEPSAPSQPEPLYLANAGLVLLHPFLPQLFSRLELLTTATDGTLRIDGLEARSRAVHLLQWLVDGCLDRPEAELSLNKLLAGLDLAAPIRPSLDASDDDLTVATELLRAVIGHWPPLANTSIDGLRETFLQREGRLDPPSSDANHWTLRVQRRTVDVLLSQLPWSFTLIKHRWLPLPLHVHW